jgi:simple sugar transport system substrate-binding protein
MKFAKAYLAVTAIAAAAFAASFVDKVVASDALPRMVVVHKQVNTPGIQIIGQGVIKGGKEFGVDASITGPTTLDPAQQLKVVQDLIAQKVDILGIVPLDVNVLGETLKGAMDAGIKVISHEGGSLPYKDWNIDLVVPKAFGEKEMQVLAKAMGEKGEYVVVVGTLTTPEHNKWADYAVAYQKEHYPDMKQATDRMPGGDDVDASQQLTLDVMKAHPAVKGFVVEGSNGPIGIGNALRQLHMQGKVGVVGTCFPSQAKQNLVDHVITECTWWNPIDSGVAMVAVGKQMMDGKPLVDGADIGGLGKAHVDAANHEIQFDKILEVTTDNVDELIKQGL